MGLEMPGLMYERWLPSCRANRKPAARNTFSRTVQCTGVILGIFGQTVTTAERLSMATHEGLTQPPWRNS